MSPDASDRTPVPWHALSAPDALARLEPAVVLELGGDAAGVPEFLLLVNPSERRIGFACAEFGFERGRLRIDTTTDDPRAAWTIERFWLERWSLALIESIVSGAIET